jgi:HSP20 family protein
MTFFYYDPLAEFEHPFADAFHARLPAQSSAHDSQVTDMININTHHILVNSMDVHEDAKDNKVTAIFELPGLKKEDVNIDVHNNRLTISGESKTSEGREAKGYAIRERSYGRFSCTLQLPAGAKVSKFST